MQQHVDPSTMYIAISVLRSDSQNLDLDLRHDLNASSGSLAHASDAYFATVFRNLVPIFVETCSKFRYCLPQVISLSQNGEYVANCLSDESILRQNISQCYKSPILIMILPLALWLINRS